MTHRTCKNLYKVASTRKTGAPRVPEPPLRRDREPAAGTGPLAEKAPAFGERVDQLETAPVLIVPAGLAPLRQADAPVVDDVHVHDRAEAHHGHRHPGRAGGVLYRVRHQLAAQQLGVAAARMLGQHVPPDPPARPPLPPPPPPSP